MYCIRLQGIIGFGRAILPDTPLKGASFAPACVLVCMYVARCMSNLGNDNTVIQILHGYRLIVSVLEKYPFCRDVL